MVENAFGILVGRFRVLLGTMQQRPKVVRDIVFTCVMLHNMLRSHQDGTGRALISANDVAALRNEQVVYVPDNRQESFEGGITSRGPTERLLQSCGHIGRAGQDLRCVDQIPWGQKLEYLSHFQD